MKKLFSISVFIVFAIGGFHCKSVKELPAETGVSSEKSLILEFGSGGGFTGAYSSFLIHSSGEIYEKNTNVKDDIELPSITSKEAEAYFNQAKEAGIKTINFNKPGNMSKYIHLTEGEKTYRVTWAFDGDNPSTPIKDLYNDLSKLIRKLKYANQ